MNWNLASETADKNAKASAKVTVSKVIDSEFSNAGIKGVCCSSKRMVSKFSSVKLVGKKLGVDCLVRPFGVKEVLSIQ